MIARVITTVAHGSVAVDLPIRIRSEMNSRDHWRTVRKRAQEHHHAVHYSLVNFRGLLKLITDAHRRIVVTFTRIGPGWFDDDNLAGGFKFCRDAVAKLIGIDDGSERFDWRYRQERGRVHSARVCIEAGGDA